MPTKCKFEQSIFSKVFGHPLRVGLYARVSTHDQQTLPLQIRAMREYASKRNWIIVAQVKEVEATIDKDLAAGLITKGDAATQRAALNPAQTSYTDSKIGEVLLTDSILEKTTTDTKSLDTLDKQAELTSEIAQLDIEEKAYRILLAAQTVYFRSLGL